MEKILGLDLGTNSIGWAIRDTSENENQIIDKGVLVFDKGVATVEGKEQPKVKERTEARGKRRNYQAEKYRKYEMLECLINQEMCPLTIPELNEWRHYKKGIGRKYPESAKFIQWLRYDFNGDGKPDFEELGFSKHENCYLFRWLAVSEQQEHKNIFKENPQLLGRVFYQLAQRRGFRKGDDATETDLIENGRPKKDNTGKIIKGEIEVVGIKVIDNLIKEKYKTLGAALYWGQKNNELEGINNNRIRNRFTYRDYYANEVDLIFENLGFDKHSDFCKTVKNAIIDQRPLRSQKGLVGYCTLDSPLKSKTGIYYKPGKKRIPLSHPLYEEYRMWGFINNLKIEPPAEVDKIEFIEKNVVPLFNRASDFYLSDKKDKKDKITKGLKSKIKELGGKTLSKYDSDLSNEDEGTRFNANTFLYRLEKIFGENWKELLHWDETLKGIEGKRNYLRSEDIWHLFYDALITKKQTDDFTQKVMPILQKHFPQITFNESDFKSVNNDFDQGYASLSASSIRRILPYLKKGLIYSQAVFVANLEKVFERKIEEKTLKSILTDFNEINRKHKSDKEVYTAVNSLISDRLYFRDRLNMGDNYMLDKYDYNDINEKIKETFKTKDWKNKTEQQQKEFKNDVAQLYVSFFRQPLGVNKSKQFYKIYRIEEQLKNLLIEKYGADENRIKNYLWHPSEQEKYPPANVKKDKNGEIIKNVNGEEVYFLGDPNPISKGFKNPMAMKTLYELKKLLNYLLLIEKIDAQTKIVIEIARELNDSNRRKAIKKRDDFNKRKRDGFKEKIREYYKDSNKQISESMLDRYELWEEQTKKCVYCTKEISCIDLLNGTAQVEHTIPAKLSNCSELFNLTIAHPECNIKKAKRIPFEWKDNYDLIMNNVKFMYARFKQHEENFERTFDRAKHAKDKQTKDKAIQDRHYEKELMNYWRKKYETFTLQEVTNQFRRQQLTDTQIITKYALPYLKTVFNRIDVQKGITTSKFRKIFQINPETNEKDRTQHTHHFEDAAVLTLIPPASIRDNILKEYNEAVDNKTLNQYKHPKPRNWEDFHQSMITELKDEIIINHITEDRTLKQSFKYKRKRGELVKDKNGNKIWQRGATTRGKLHDESIFGMVKMPETEFRAGKHRLKITDGKLTFQKNETRKDELFVVKKIKINDFKSLKIIKAIVIDPNLRYYLRKEITDRMRKMSVNERSFEKAILKPIYAFGKEKDKNGDQLQPIRHIRCKIKTGENSYVHFPVEIKPVEETFISKRTHKQFTYANNAELPVCTIYEWKDKGKIEREIEPVSILQMSKSFHFDKNSNFVE
jgi:CRISPR-associated endonuclease Csn1